MYEQVGSNTTKWDRYKSLDDTDRNDEYKNRINDTEFKINKKNKFRTFPKSWLRQESAAERFDRKGAKIDSATIDGLHHITFRDEIKRKPLIKIIEVESYKKYNADSNWSNELWWIIQ